MAKKVIYPPVKETIRLGVGRLPNGTSTYTHEPPYLVSMKPVPRPSALTSEEVKEIRRCSRARPLKPPSRRELAFMDRALEKLGVKKRGVKTEDRLTVVYELSS